ncbi:MSCRAMM family protein [Ignicoccus hospitalis]|uniref:PEGA domain-containing protein n=1 Tax=Ignicoccus hospitalis (strain KIN4/I / DSM 18386 / JCM 14125) TaxID=453591 RepID=A8A8E9_IGNH4|nr:PEGA domain-containing protein [Ignicoccus hospitalis]ABU81201.1 hypothetical protein Igni_0017 [Ignicoccus hospitalis KIN4/I]
MKAEAAGVAWKEVMRLALLLILMTFSVFASQYSVSLSNLTPVKITNAYEYKVLDGTIGSPEKFWFSRPNVIFTYANGELNKYTITDRGVSLVSSKKLDNVVWALQQNETRVIIVTNSSILITNNALDVLHKIDFDAEGFRAAGKSERCSWFSSSGKLLKVCPSNLKVYDLPRGTFGVLKPGGISFYPLWKLAGACKVNVTSFQESFINNITFVLLKSERSSKLAKIVWRGGPRLLNCKELGREAYLSNTSLVLTLGGSVGIKYVDLAENVTFTLFGASLAKLLGLSRSPLGYEAYVLLVKPQGGGDLLLSLRAKDSNPMFATFSENMFCTPLPSFICFPEELAYRPISFQDVASPHSAVEVALTKRFVEVAGESSVEVNLKPLSAPNKAYTLRLSIQEPSKTVLLPSDTYELNVKSKIGRVVLFVGAPPPGTDFDPPVIRVEITPDVIIPYVYKLKIKVVDEQTGNPLPGALVYVSGVTVRGKRLQLGPQVTDANGTVVLHLEKGTYMIRVVKDYYKPVVIRNLVLDNDKSIAVKMIIKGTDVKIKVMSKGAPPFIPKGPIANATVSIQGRIALEKKTDKNGLAEVVLLPGTYTLRASAPLHKPHTETLNVVPSNKPLVKEVTLDPILYNLTLVIKDSLTGRLVIPSLISITSLTSGLSKVIKNPATGTVLVTLPPDVYSIKVLAKNYLPFEETYNISKSMTLTIPLKLKTVKVRIMVFDELKNLVPAFNITLVNQALGLKFEFSLTSENNTVSVPPGTYRLTISAKGYEPLTTTVTISENTKVLQLTIAHKSFNVVIKAKTDDKLLYEFIFYCEGQVQGGPLFEPLPLPRMTKPSLQATIRVPRGTYMATLTCYSATKEKAATGSATFTVPTNAVVEVPLTPTKTSVAVTVLDVRTNKPVVRATVKLYYGQNKLLIGEGMTDATGRAIINVNTYYMGKPVEIVITAPGYQEYRSSVILTRQLPVVYLKPAPTIIETILGNPVLLIAVVLVGAAGAYLASMFVGRGGEEEEIFEELV